MAAPATCRRWKRWPPSILLHHSTPDLKIRVINVVDLMTLQPQEEHPHGLSSGDFDSLFTTDKPIIFAYHGYPWLIHRLTYRRTNHDNLHVRGYKEEGTTTTPFDMVVLNDLDRFHLVMDVAKRVPKLQRAGAHIKQAHARQAQRAHAVHPEHGEDMPEIRDWQWPAERRDERKSAAGAQGARPARLAGQSVAHLFGEGGLQRLIDEDGVDGVTSNPAIFEKAIAGSPCYRDDLERLRGADSPPRPATSRW